NPPPQGGRGLVGYALTLTLSQRARGFVDYPGDTSTTVFVDFGNSGGSGRPRRLARSSMKGLNLPEEPVEITSRAGFTRFGIERLPSIVSSFMLSYGSQMISFVAGSRNVIIGSPPSSTRSTCSHSMRRNRMTPTSLWPSFFLLL